VFTLSHSSAVTGPVFFVADADEEDGAAAAVFTGNGAGAGSVAGAGVVWEAVGMGAVSWMGASATFGGGASVFEHATTTAKMARRIEAILDQSQSMHASHALGEGAFIAQSSSRRLTSCVQRSSELL
jgi:hypothetical protein